MANKTSSGTLIREARTKAGLTQGMLGEQVGMSGAMIGHFEQNHAKVRRDIAERLSKILSIPLQAIDISSRGTRQAAPSSTARRSGTTGRSPVTTGTARPTTTPRAAAATRSTSRRVEAGGLSITNPDEIAMLNSLRSLRGKQRKAVLDLVQQFASPPRAAAAKVAPAASRTAGNPRTSGRRKAA